MLVIESENGDKHEIALLIKFQTEENIKKMQQGYIYTNNLKHYIDLEEKEGKIGIGDRDEGTLLLNDVDCKFRDTATGEDIPIERIFFGEKGEQIKIKVKGIRIQLDDDIKTPVLCLVGINKNETKNIDGNLILDFDDKTISKLREEFGGYTHALVIEPENFTKRLIEECEKQNIHPNLDFVKYYDPKINQGERVNDFNTIKSVFWKNDSFKNQKEFRVAFGNKHIESGQVLMNLGDISDISIMVDINTLLSKEFSIKILNK